jgi:predicted secreted protein
MACKPNLAVFFVILTVAFALTGANPRSALAGDIAERQIFGFNADGSRFAFEEYGIQDGSGFPFSNIYVINTSNDSWADGSPFRVVKQDEELSLDAARQEAHAMAKNALADIIYPGLLAATNSPLEINDNPHRVVFHPHEYVGSISESIELRIETIAMVGKDYCADFGPTVGFRLSQVYLEEGKATRVLHADTKIPDSRGCPLDYRFSDVLIHYPENAPAVMAIVVMMETVGFEGPDTRYLAVTAKLE